MVQMKRIALIAFDIYFCKINLVSKYSNREFQIHLIFALKVP